MKRRTLDPERDVGLSWVIGAPRCGKTRFALSSAWTFSRSRSVPMLVVDSAGVDQCVGIAAAPDFDTLVRMVWQEGLAARFVPDGPEDVDRIVEAVERGKDIALVIDEANQWLSAQSRSSGLLRLMRKVQHARVRAWFTTQHLTGDVPQSAISCSPELVVFRCTSRTVLDALERDYGLDPRTVRALPQDTFLRVSTGFAFSA